MIEALFPVISTKVAFDPTFTFDAAALEDICVTVLKIFVVVTVPPAVGPAICSLIDVPSMLVPVIVNVLDDKSFELLIVTSEFKKGALDAPALLDFQHSCAVRKADKLW